MMKAALRRMLLLLLLLLLLPRPAALAEAAEEQESILDEDYLNEWAETYLRENGLDNSWQDFSVGFCYTATGDCWYYNADVFMYSASLYKVPVAMLAAEKVAAGELSQEDTSMGVSLSYLEESALIYSNNDSGHMLVHLMGGTDWGKCSDQLIRYTDLDEDYFIPDFYGSSFYTARFMTQVMRTLYEGGEERFPHVIECLLQAQPDGYLNLSMKDRWPVAQKYGAYEEAGGPKNNHVSAIIFTPNPIVVVVMTRNVGMFQDHIAAFGGFLADYALTLDQELERREAAAATPEPTPVPTSEPTPEPTPESSPEPTTESTPAPSAEASEAPAPQPGPEPGQTAPSPLALYAVPTLLALAVLSLVVHGIRRARRKVRRRR
ncbi:MAG: serine hydrolase [Oscillospiraceae bacterium]|nr:serine hydrolase [Oscillospiraceae bacterium]